MWKFQNSNLKKKIENIKHEKENHENNTKKFNKKCLIIISSTILLTISIIVLIILLLSCKKTKKFFIINGDNIPTSLTTGYNATSWTQTVSITPMPDSIDYSLINVDSDLNGNLSIDESGSSITSVKLDLATGIMPGTYAYTVHGIAHKLGYTDSTIDKTCSLTISNATFSTFTIDDDNIPTNLITGYSATNWTQTASTSPSADSIDYTLINEATSLSGKLDIDTSGSSTTGVKLNLATGVMPGTYAYTVHGIAHKLGYTDFTYDKTCSLIIGNATFNTFTIYDNTIPTDLIIGYSATSWTQTVSTTPSADSIDYTITNEATSLTGKLTVDSSSTVIGVKLNLATGVMPGTYAYTVHGVAHKLGYTDYITDKTCSLTISDPSFTTFTIDDDNIPTNLTTGYSATSWTQTVTTDPTPADSIDYSLINVATALSGKLDVNTSGSSTTGVELDLATGIMPGTYAYTVHGVAHKSGYTDATYDKTCSLTIANGTFTTFTISGSTIPTPTPVDTQVRWSQSVSTTPSADSINYSLTNLSSFLVGRLSISSSSATSVSLLLTNGVITSSGIYSYTIHAVAQKTGYNNSTVDFRFSITIR